MAPVTFGSLVRGPAMSSLSRPLSPSAPLILRKNGGEYAENSADNRRKTCAGCRRVELYSRARPSGNCPYPDTHRCINSRYRMKSKKVKR